VSSFYPKRVPQLVLEYSSAALFASTCLDVRGRPSNVLRISDTLAFFYSLAMGAQLTPSSFSLSATSQQYFSLRTNQPPASSAFLSEQISTSHQPPAKRTGCKLQALRSHQQKILLQRVALPSTHSLPS
jgi:hypothetical protein